MSVDNSKLWLDLYARDLGVPYEQLMERATRYLRDGSLWRCGERFEDVPYSDEFWQHYGVVIGRTIPDDERGHFFACTC